MIPQLNPIMIKLHATSSHRGVRTIPLHCGTLITRPRGIMRAVIIGLTVILLAMNLSWNAAMDNLEVKSQASALVSLTTHLTTPTLVSGTLIMHWCGRMVAARLRLLRIQSMPQHSLALNWSAARMSTQGK
jgi:hypothetical protein